MSEEQKREKILVVEDSPTQAEELSYALKKNGYSVLHARNGREALEAIHRERPDLVISDIIMPEMDGFALCKKIKAVQDMQSIPVFLLSALSDPEDVLKGLECGADNFITKPYKEAYLIGRINDVLANGKHCGSLGPHIDTEICFKGQKYSITSEKSQILDLLLSTYETAVMRNNELKEVRQKLELLNEQLEKKVEDRTAALITEIGERRKAEEEVRRLNAELERRVVERTEQLETANQDLESFSYSVSHDLKAPLRAINGFSQLLIEEYGDKIEPKAKELLDVIGDRARHMGKLMDDILTFSRAGRQELFLGEIDMDQLARSVVSDLLLANPATTAKIEIGTLQPARGDLSAVRQILTNLVSNAIKFSSERERPLIEIGFRDGGQENSYYVKDNGVGFDMKYADKLFGVFQRLHGREAFDGTGIGLAIVKRFVTKLGGRIWAEGKVNEGSVFHFTLPKAN